jgi:hypothetical protein
MSQNLADLMPAQGARAGLRLWLKSSAYSRRLLLGEAGDPWEGASNYLAYFSQGQGLLKPDVAVIEVGELFESWLRRNPGLRAEMGSKRKLSFPLRRLLEQAPARALLAEVVAAVLANLGGQQPLVLAMPSPRRWLLQAAGEAGRADLEPDPDSIEDAAMYMADLVRSVSGLAVGGILFEEAQDVTDGAPVNLELYRPIINVARHYRWPLALRAGPGGVADSAAVAEFDVFIGAADVPAAARAHGVDASAQLRAGQPLPPLLARQFYFLEIARDATPERVLDSLATLRAA